MASKSGPAFVSRNVNIFDGVYADMSEFCKQLDDRIGKHLERERETVAKTFATKLQSMKALQLQMVGQIDQLADTEVELFGSSVRGTISGIASHHEKNANGFVVKSGALTCTLPIPLRLEHGPTIGVVRSARETDEGLFIEATVADSSTFKSAAIRKRLDDAWADLEAGKLSGFSVGARRGESEIVKGIRTYTRSKLLEVSACADPGQERAVIKSVKAAVRRERQALFFDGPYRDGGEYEPGDLVQAKGTVFVCTKSTTGKPGSDDGWRLLVKSGRNSEAE